MFDEHSCFLVEPLHALAVLPEAVLDALLLLIDVGSEAVLLAFVPPAFVPATVSPEMDAVALFLIVKVGPVVSDAVGVDEYTMALHVVGGPLAVVHAAILPQVGAVPVDLVIEPVAMVSGSVSPGVRSGALLLAHRILALVFGSFWPGLHAFPMLLVFLPVALIACLLDVGINAIPVGLFVKPLTIIDVTVGVEELALAASLVILPVALVASVVWPDHTASSVSETTFPLASVNGTSLVGVDSSLQRHGVRVGTIKSFPRLVALEILALDFARHLKDAVLSSLEEASNQRLQRDDSGEEPLLVPGAPTRSLCLGVAVLLQELMTANERSIGK